MEIIMMNNFPNLPILVIKWLLHPQLSYHKWRLICFLSMSNNNNCLVCNKNPFNQLIYGYFCVFVIVHTLSLSLALSLFKQRNPPRLIIPHTCERHLILSFTSSNNKNTFQLWQHHLISIQYDTIFFINSYCCPNKIKNN